MNRGWLLATVAGSALALVANQGIAQSGAAAKPDMAFATT